MKEDLEMKLDESSALSSLHFEVKHEDEEKKKDD
jgi:hypothetical protein